MKNVVLTTLALLACLPAFAAEGPLSARLEAYRVVTDAHGAERLAPDSTARPSDVVEYRTTYRNSSPKALRQVAATLPVPTGFVYVSGTATRGVLASLDGVTFAAVPLTRRIKGAAGNEITVPVPLAEYRALRWNLGDMPANSTRVVTARMRMDDSNVVAAR
jgi:uncharacterized repeat protein (TIGR01451 family)